MVPSGYKIRELVILKKIHKDVLVYLRESYIFFKESEAIILNNQVVDEYLINALNIAGGNHWDMVFQDSLQSIS